MKPQIIILFLISICCACQPDVHTQSGVTDYQKELQQIDFSISNLKSKHDKTTERSALRVIYHLYQRATLTSDYNDFQKLENLIDTTIEEFDPSIQLLMFRAHLNFKLHRFADAQQDLITINRLGGHQQAEVLAADIALQMGGYAAAAETYTKLSNKEEPAWDHIARLAYYYANTGQTKEADRLYYQAQQMMNAKQMRHYAWLSLQRGIVYLENENYDIALDHFLHANQAYSGYWLIQEHIAEIYALTGGEKDAIELYEGVIQQTQKPEYISALAALLITKDPSRANELQQRADALFRAQQQFYPEATSAHYIESLLEREEINPEIINFANSNHQLRPNAEAKLLLAKCHIVLGNTEEARNLVIEILATPWRSKEIEELKQKFDL